MAAMMKPIEKKNKPLVEFSPCSLVLSGAPRDNEKTAIKQEPPVGEWF